MRFFRPIIAMLLVLAWVPATNSCALAAMFPQSFAHCADEDGDASKGVPCSSGCAKCVTLENGSDLSALQAITVDAPDWTEVSEWLRFALTLVEQEPQEVFPGLSPDERPPWQVIARTAPPVRGPSLAA